MRVARALPVGVGVLLGLVVAEGVAVGVRVGRGVGVGRGVRVGVGFPPTAHRSAAALQFGPLKIVRLTTLLLKVTPFAPLAQQYLPLGFFEHGESAAQAEISVNIRQISAEFEQLGFGPLEQTAGLLVL